MGAPQLGRVLAHLRSVLLKEKTAELSDGALLNLYLRHRNEAAFETLVRRHGPMVLGVCRRVLHNSHDAEDAFQATLLVLVRKASSLRTPGLVGNWLYGVAYRTALEAKKVAAKRRAKEAKVIPRMAKPTDAWDDLRTVLDQELDRLPDKYRAVIVLCDLEGMTRKEAARRLGWPEGTVASRLAGARKTLAKRLSRHELALSGGALAALVSQNAMASLPAALVANTIQAASLSAAGQIPAGLISAQVALLTQGVIKSMLLTKLKMTTAVCLLAGLTSCGIGVLSHKVSQAALAESPQEAKAVLPKAPQAGQEKSANDAAKSAESPVNGPLGASPPRVLIACKTPVACLAWSPDGRWIAVGTQDEMIRVIEVATRQEVHSFPVNAAPSALAFSPDGKKLALSQPGAPASIWDIEGGKQQPGAGRVGGNFAPFTNVSFTPDGQTVAAIAVGQMVRAGPTGGSSMMMANPGGPGGTAISPDGAVGGWCDAKGLVRYFDLALRAQGPSKGLQVGATQCIAFGPGGKWLAVGADKGVQLWDLPENKKTLLLTGLDQPAAQLSISADGRTLAGRAADGVTIRIWEVSRDRALCQINHFQGAVGREALSPDGKLLATTIKGGNQVFLWKVAARQLTQQGPPLNLNAQELMALWTDMANPDADKADAAWKKLGAAGDSAVVFLGQQIRPIAAPPFDAKRLDDLVIELDSDKFATRDRATQDLMSIGELAIVPLQRHQEKGLSLEANKRVRSVLDKLGQSALTPERRRVLEAIELLEHLRTAKAIALLQETEREALIPQIRLEARQALQRLAEWEKVKK